MNSGFLEVDYLVAEGKGKLLRLKFTGHIRTRERPIKDGNRASKHALHGLLCQTLGILAPLNSHGSGTTDIRHDNRRANVAVGVHERCPRNSKVCLDSPGTIALYPTILREDEAVQLLAEVLDHVIPFRLAMDENIKANSLLEPDNSLNFLLDKLFVLCLSNLLFTKFGTRLTDFFRLLNHGREASTR